MPIIGVNTFLSKEGSPTVIPDEVIRADKEEKEYAIAAKLDFQKRNEAKAHESLAQLKQAALENQNMFTTIMEASKFCSLGQISNQLYEVGGQYRRNM